MVFSPRSSASDSCSPASTSSSVTFASGDAPQRRLEDSNPSGVSSRSPLKGTPERVSRHEVCSEGASSFGFLATYRTSTASGTSSVSSECPSPTSEAHADKWATNGARACLSPSSSRRRGTAAVVSVSASCRHPPAEGENEVGCAHFNSSFLFPLSHCGSTVRSVSSTTVPPSPFRTSSSPFPSSEDDAGKCTETREAPLVGYHQGGADATPRRAGGHLESAEQPTVHKGSIETISLSRVSSVECPRRSRASPKAHLERQAETSWFSSCQRSTDGAAWRQRVDQTFREQGLADLFGACSAEPQHGNAADFEDSAAVSRLFVRDSASLFADVARTWKIISPSVGCVCLYLVVSPLLAFCNKLLYLPSLSSSPLTCTMLQQILIVLAFCAARRMYTWGRRRPTGKRAEEAHARSSASEREAEGSHAGYHSSTLLAKTLAKASRARRRTSKEENEDQARPCQATHTREQDRMDRRKRWRRRRAEGLGGDDTLDTAEKDGEQIWSGFVLRPRGRILDRSSSEEPVSLVARCRRLVRAVAGAFGPCLSIRNGQAQVMKHLSSVPRFSKEMFEMCGPVALPYTLMLACSNRCLYTSSLSGYHVARCSSIPLQLLLDVLGVDVRLSHMVKKQGEADGASLQQRVVKAGNGESDGETEHMQTAATDETDHQSAAVQRVKLGDETCAPSARRNPVAPPGRETPGEASQTVAPGWRHPDRASTFPSGSLQSGGSSTAANGQGHQSLSDFLCRRMPGGPCPSRTAGGAHAAVERGPRRLRVRSVCASLLLCFSPFFSSTSLRHLSSRRSLQARLRELGVSSQRLAACTCISVGFFCLAIDGQKLSLDGALMGLGASLFGTLYMQLSSHLLQRARAHRTKKTPAAAGERSARRSPADRVAENAHPQTAVPRPQSSEAEASDKDFASDTEPGVRSDASAREEIDLPSARGVDRRQATRDVWRTARRRRVHQSAGEPRTCEEAVDAKERFAKDQSRLETGMALHTAATAALLLSPLAFAEQLCFSEQAGIEAAAASAISPVSLGGWDWTRLGTFTALLLCSGLLASLIPLTSYFCFRHLSPLSCCIVGFFKSSVQILVSPLLLGEARPSLVACLAANLCLLGCGIYALDSCRSMTKQFKEGER
ncbi:conserved hypothetical protein [Neospora caninum Liverpool]|uniref:Transmembrane protein n=1 Tax=Neospora caninum (strain Liverpool) TaxID=572307 RepID=F0VLH7_NEOCL|nr:conserved hypothetical protein [Neospora caninum Liverpool]CBZ54105.1 conserved hypothetical protein [Neospora caninum Liverpool]CEL68804.1 TPA: hypothetical protein BN1204_045380 [Neospora caninum Liverpool]|eukprot:XP_003884136.1 conserved hypothetical protein [Neospora caninum Liverpool]